MLKGHPDQISGFFIRKKKKPYVPQNQSGEGININR